MRWRREATSGGASQGLVTMNIPATPVTFPILCVWTLAVFAAIWDVTQRRIPNPLILIGLILGFTLRGMDGGVRALVDALMGAGLALAVFIVPFMVRKVGGGDVKLAMVFGVFLGPMPTLWVILGGTVLNGAIALALLITRRVLLARGRSIPPKLEQVPKAVALGIALFYVTLASKG